VFVMDTACTIMMVRKVDTPIVWMMLTGYNIMRRNTMAKQSPEISTTCPEDRSISRIMVG